MGKARRPGPKPVHKTPKHNQGSSKKKKASEGASRDRAAVMKAELRAKKKQEAPPALKETGGEGAEEEEDVGDEDVEFFDEHEGFASFLQSMEGNGLVMVGKRHRTKDEKVERRVRPRPEEGKLKVEDEGDGTRKASTKGWERQPPKGKPRLPIKTVDGKVLPVEHAQSEEEEGEEEVQGPEGGEEKDTGGGERDEVPDDESESDEDVDDEDDEEDGFDDEDIVVPTKRSKTSTSLPLDGALDLNLSRGARLELKKMEIASLCEEILEDPEESIMKPCGSGPGGKQQTRMQRALSQLNDGDKAVQQLAILSVLAVFKDILPSYRIRLPTEKELSQKVSKDVKRVREYERAMLASYQAYLKHLEVVVNQRSVGASSSTTPSPLPPLALRCLSDLLVWAPHFNFASNILTCLVKQATCRSHSAEALAFRKDSCKALRQLFEKDEQGDISLTAVRLIAKELKSREGKPSEAADLMQTLLSVRLRVHEDEAHEAKSRALKEMKRRRHLKGRGDDVEAGLKEAEGRVDPVQRAKFQAESLQEVTLTYFRVLKMKPPNPRLLPVALEGLSRIAHLINLDTVQDLVGVLKELLAVKAALPPLSSLHCVLTGLRTLQGPGRELRVDDKELITALYSQLGRIRSRATLILACTCLRAALIERREYSLARVAAFYKRLIGISLTTGPQEAQALLLLAKELNVAYPGVDAMLEGEQDRVSTGEFRPDVAEPELSNALASAVWEVSLSSKHFHPQVKAAVRMLRQGSSMNEGSKLLVRGQDVVGEMLRRRDEEALRLANLFVRVPKPNPLHQLMAKQGSSGPKTKMYFVRLQAAKARGTCKVGGLNEGGVSGEVDGHAVCRTFYRRMVRHRKKVQMCRELQGMKRVLGLHLQRRQVKVKKKAMR